MVVSIDVRRTLFGRYEVYSELGTKKSKLDPVSHAQHVEQMGAGEVLLTCIDRDGTMAGFDLELLDHVSSAVSIPVIAMAGAGTLDHLRDAVKAGASAVAAGSMFVFQGKHRAVLINYPKRKELECALS